MRWPGYSITSSKRPGISDFAERDLWNVELRSDALKFDVRRASSDAAVLIGALTQRGYTLGQNLTYEARGV